MLMLPRRLTLCLALVLASAAAAAGESFYPIVGPGGGIEFIKSRPDGAGAGQPAPAAGAAEPVPAASSSRPVAADEAPASRPTGARYDSEEYVDSEELDSAWQRGGRQRFYLIDDGMGRQTSHAGEGSVDAVADVPSQAPAAEEVSYPLQVAEEVLSAEAAQRRFPALPVCLDPKSRAAAKAIQVGFPAEVVLDRHTYAFLPDSRIVAVYRIGGAGLRNMEASSFSRRDRQPAFASPYLAFLDEQGCLTRVQRSPYQRLYPATTSRHPVLKAELAVHTEEAFMLVLASPAEAEKPAPLPYAPSSYGQLKFTLKK